MPVTVFVITHEPNPDETPVPTNYIGTALSFMSALERCRKSNERGFVKPQGNGRWIVDTPDSGRFGIRKDVAHA